MLVLFQVGTMDKRALLAFIFAICTASGGCLQAYSAQSMSALMIQYSVPASVTLGLNASSLAYSGGNYVAFYQGPQLYFLVNVTNPNSYSFVINSTSIYNVIKGHATSAAVLQADVSALVAQMRAYQASSASNITDCLQETGLASGATCTTANNCFSCESVPVCNMAVAGNASLAKGISTFGSQYQQLNQSLIAFYAAAAATNTLNAQAQLPKITSAFNNIANITKIIYQNPIFPPTANITASMYASTCLSLTASSNLPWYCTAIGFCGNLNYNYTKLAKMQGMLSGLNALPFSTSQMQLAAKNASAIENTYVMPVLSSQKKALVAPMLNASSPGYGSLVNQTGSLLARVSNATLSYDLSALEATYANITANYATINLTAANTIIASQYAALQGQYAKVNATYSSLARRAQNNTVKLLELQMNGGAPPAVANLAFQEFALNAQAFSGSGIASITALNGSLGAIASSLASYSTGGSGPVELARSFFRPFLGAMAYVTGMGYSESVSLAPLLGALITIIIGAIVFALVLRYRSSLHKHHRVVLTHKTRRNWKIVLAVLLALIILDIISNYVLLSYASSSAPFGSVSGALASSKQLVIAINGTPTQEESACSAAIGAAAKSKYGAAVTSATFNNGLCTSGTITGSVDECMHDFTGGGIPVVVLTETSGAQSLNAYSLYGTRLTVTGPAAVMTSCYAQYLFR
jgi:hypothetical protein